MNPSCSRFLSKKPRHHGKIAVMKMIEGKRALVTLARGVTELSKLVATTYGPRGAKVAVSKQGKVLITTDGSALAREVCFQDSERLGSSLVRSATSVVDGDSGDGTSTTILLAGAILESALDNYTSRTWDPVSIVRDIRDYLPAVESLITDMARTPDERVLHRVAMISSHGEDLVADRVVEAVTTVGENGTVLLSAGEGVGIELDYREGLVLDVGWASHSMGRGDGGTRDFDGPLVAVVNGTVGSFDDVRSLMEEASQWPGRGLVLFCARILGGAVTTLTLNDAKGVLPCIAISYVGPPDGASGWLEDLAAMTSSHVVDVLKGDDLREFKPEWLGSARKVSVSKNRTEILSYPDASDRIGERVLELHRQAEVSTYDYDKDRLRERASAMDGGLCTLKVGGYTEAEAQDRRSRAEDTLHAVRQALVSGVVPGAGRAYQFVSTMPELQETMGGQILARALEEPFRVLCDRSHATYQTVTEKLGDDPWVGWCPVREIPVDFWDGDSVVDPLGVVLSSLRAAVSVACEVILTGVVLAKDTAGPDRRSRTVSFQLGRR